MSEYDAYQFMKQDAAERSQNDTRLIAPRTREELAVWVETFLGVKMPRTAVCLGHSTPLDYLECVFFEKELADPLVIACRGGGKTFMAAVATLLDMLFKPGSEIRILGGSTSQSERMYEHLVRMVERKFRDQMISSGRLSRITKTGFCFANGSRVELLAQTESSVRGARVQKVRCDEVDLFDRKVWSAVQLTTRTKRNAEGVEVRGSIEALSTINGPEGVVSELLKNGKHKLFKWCLWDVIEKCHDQCSTCNLAKDCRQIARNGEGFFPVSDARTMRDRVSDWTWQYEMLCDPQGAKKKQDKVIVRYY